MTISIQTTKITIATQGQNNVIPGTLIFSDIFVQVNETV
jgi:hypothetical protein